MDMSFAFRVPRAAPAPRWAVLVAAAAARQAVSPTASAQALLDRPGRAPERFAPADGRFSVTTAESLAGWKEG